MLSVQSKAGNLRAIQKEILICFTKMKTNDSTKQNVKSMLAFFIKGDRVSDAATCITLYPSQLVLEVTNKR